MKDAEPRNSNIRPEGDRRGAYVLSVSADTGHNFSKQQQPAIRLLEGLGAEGDAHSGTTVQHLSRVARDPTQPNLRQVHLIHCELFDEVAQHGHRVIPGDLGENITTAGVDLLSLPVDTLLRIGPEAELRLTGLRNPCRQIDNFAQGLLKQMVGVDENGQMVRKAGVMAVVRRSGEVRSGDTVTVVLPPEPHLRLERV